MASMKIDCSTCVSRQSNHIFCSLEGPALDIVNRHKVLSRYKKGQYIFYEGNSPSGLYCINSGAVKIETEGLSGQGHILRVVPSGGVLGYRSLFAEESYEASAVTLEDAQVCYIPRSAIFELMEKFPDVGRRFLSHVSKELRIAEGRFCSQTDKSAAQRVAESLLFLKERFPDQGWTRKEIAEWAGTTPETVMRTLADFEDEGFIEQIGRKIELRNKTALMKKAEISL